MSQHEKLEMLCRTGAVGSLWTLEQSTAVGDLLLSETQVVPAYPPIPGGALGELGRRLSEMLDEEDFANIEQYLFAAAVPQVEQPSGEAVRWTAKQNGDRWSVYDSHGQIHTTVEFEVDARQRVDTLNNEMDNARGRLK